MLPVRGLVTETEDGFMSACGAQSTGLFYVKCKRKPPVRCKLIVSNELEESEGVESVSTVVGYL